MIGDDQASGPLGRVLGGLQGIFSVTGGMLSANVITGLARQFGDLARSAVSAAREGLQATADYEMLSMSLASLAARELRSTDSSLTMADALAATSGEAEQLLNWVTQLAIKSPFDQEGVANAFRTAMAYGFTTDQAKRLAQATIDMATATGRGTADMNSIALALGQVQAKGRLAGQEILQLVNAGVPVLQVLADHFGKTTAEVQEMVSAGLVPADEVFQAIIGSMEQDFGGARRRASSSWAGLMNTLGDLKTIGLREFFSSALEEMQPFVASFTDWLQGPGLQLIGLWGEKVGDFAADVLNLASYLGTAVANGDPFNEFLFKLPANIRPVITEIGTLVAQAKPLFDWFSQWLPRVPDVRADMPTNMIAPGDTTGVTTPDMLTETGQKQPGGGSTFMDALKQIIPPEVIQSWNALGAALDYLVSVLDENGDSVIDWLVRFDAISPEAADGGGSLAESLMSAADAVNWVATAFQNVETWVFNATDWIKGAWGVLTTFLRGAWDDLTGYLSTAVPKWWAPFQWFINTVIDGFNWWYNVLVGHSIVPDTINAILDEFGRMLDIEGILDSVTGFFRDLPGKITGIFENFSLYDLGANIVQGLINGLLSKLGPLEDVVAGLVNKARAAGGQAAGEGSPAREFMPLGASIGEGVQKGVLGTMGGMREAMGALIGAGTGVSAGAIGAGVGRGAYAYIPITINGATDPRAVAREVRQEIARDLRPLGVSI